MKEDSVIKENQTTNQLLETLIKEKEQKLKGSIYHKIQIEFTYNSNHMEGSKLSQEQTRYIFETNTVGIEGKPLNIDDVVETTNHFRCIDMIIDSIGEKLTEDFIKKLHFVLKSGTSEAYKEWFNVGEYKKLPNEVGGKDTSLPEDVPKDISRLLQEYNMSEQKSFDDILDFHYRFERIHPFQDGNGRVGRLILLKECLENDIVPFIIDDELKYYYYRGLSMWAEEKGFLKDTCLAAQDKMKGHLEYFRIEYLK